MFLSCLRFSGTQEAAHREWMFLDWIHERSCAGWTVFDSTTFSVVLHSSLILLWYNYLISDNCSGAQWLNLHEQKYFRLEMIFFILMVRQPRISASPGFSWPEEKSWDGDWEGNWSENAAMPQWHFCIVTTEQPQDSGRWGGGAACWWLRGGMKKEQASSSVRDSYWPTSPVCQMLSEKGSLILFSHWTSVLLKEMGVTLTRSLQPKI